MEQVKRYLIKCNLCGQEGVLQEIEKYEVPDAVAPGECADDMSVYFYEFKVLKGDFVVEHWDPNSYSHKVVCSSCGCEVAIIREL